MNILFSNPPWWIERNSKGQWRYGVRAGSRWPWSMWGKSSPGRRFHDEYVPYPFFMGFAASYCMKYARQHNILFRDSIANKETKEKYFQYIVQNKIDMVFIESSTPSWNNDLQIIRQIKKLRPKIKVILTGPTIAATAEQVMSTGLFHACIKGEYEKGSLKVIDGAEGIIDFDIMSQEEMNSSPYPYYDESIAKTFWGNGTMDTQKQPVLQAWTSRGCPYKCIFCLWPATMTNNDPDGSNNRRARKYSKDWLEGFLCSMVNKYHYNGIHFDDDTMNLGDKHTLEVCEIMRKINLPWSAMCRCDTVSKNIWQEMKDSGCKGVCLGFESGDQWVVDNIVNKKLNLDEAAETVRYIRSLGMSVHGSFTIGLPGESEEQIAKTRQYISDLPFTSIQLSGCGVMEGTPIDSVIRNKQLNAYKGAVKDEKFINESDGMKKLEKLKGE